MLRMPSKVSVFLLFVSHRQLFRIEFIVGGEIWFFVVAGKTGSIEGMVRVTNPHTGQRALIRGKSSEVLDLQFAHIKSQIMLASIEMSSLHVHKIETLKENIICTLLLKVEDPLAEHVPKFDKINWCPYVPENEMETDSDAGKLLVWTRGASFQCYNVGAVVDAYGVSFSILLLCRKAHSNSNHLFSTDWHTQGRRYNGRCIEI